MEYMEEPTKLSTYNVDDVSYLPNFSLVHVPAVVKGLGAKHVDAP